MDYCPGGPLSTVQPMAVIECVTAATQKGNAAYIAHVRKQCHVPVMPPV